MQTRKLIIYEIVFKFVLFSTKKKYLFAIEFNKNMWDVKIKFQT